MRTPSTPTPACFVAAAWLVGLAGIALAGGCSGRADTACSPATDEAVQAMADFEAWTGHVVCVESPPVVTGDLAEDAFSEACRQFDRDTGYTVEHAAC